MKHHDRADTPQNARIPAITFPDTSAHTSAKATGDTPCSLDEIQDTVYGLLACLTPQQWCALWEMICACTTPRQGAQVALWVGSSALAPLLPL